MVKAKLLKQMNEYKDDKILNSGGGHILLKDITGEFTNEFTVDLTINNTKNRIKKCIEGFILDNANNNIKLAVQSVIDCKTENETKDDKDKKPSIEINDVKFVFDTPTLDLVKNNFTNLVHITKVERKEFTEVWVYDIDSDIMFKTCVMNLGFGAVEHIVLISKYNREDYISALNRNVDNVLENIKRERKHIRNLRKIVKQLEG